MPQPAAHVDIGGAYTPKNMAGRLDVFFRMTKAVKPRASTHRRS